MIKYFNGFFQAQEYKYFIGLKLNSMASRPWYSKPKEKKKTEAINT